MNILRELLKTVVFILAFYITASIMSLEFDIDDWNIVSMVIFFGPSGLLILWFVYDLVSGNYTRWPSIS
ncbi:MAG: hypothetical protein QF371_08340, partial [Flavobacteriales bacterium]|nr:hypothetical protein [Flavobacteriales bacterium]